MLPLPITQIDLSAYIETRLFGERPHLVNRRIPIATIARSAQELGWSVERLKEEFFISEAEVLAALLYYAEHHALIEAQESVYQSELNRLTERKHG